MRLETYDKRWLIQKDGGNTSTTLDDDDDD